MKGQKQPDGRPGVERGRARVAAALLLFDTNSVERPSIRALMPEGKTRRNSTRSLKDFERWGLIACTETTVQILKRRELRKLVRRNLQPDTARSLQWVLRRWQQNHPDQAQQSFAEHLARMIKPYLGNATEV